MQRPGVDPENVQMSDILCDFCHREWAETEPMIEGHRGSCLCGNCLTIAYREVVLADPPDAEPGVCCTLCLQPIQGPAWRSPAYPDAAVCRRCIKQAAGVMHKSKEYRWTKPE